MKLKRYEIHIYDDVCVDLFNNGVLDKSINNTYKLEDLLNQQDKRIKELEEENLSLQEQSIRDNQNWIEETTQLKQQLHDLPKKIVEEIREYMPKRIMEKQIKWGDNIQIGFICNAINECLDTTLEKFGGEDESK